MSFMMETDAFMPNGKIPERYAHVHDNVSPRLKWRDMPQGTKELALIVDDPDAPTPQPWVHWLIYKIPGDATELPEGVQHGARAGVGSALHGKNSWDQLGYDGPEPPKGHGTHHYNFTLYALDDALKLAPGATVDELRRALQEHTLATAHLVGTYERH